MSVPAQILNQLGGNKFVAMTGAQCYADGNKLIVKFKGSKVANLMSIELNSMDLYDVIISKVTGVNVKIIKSVEGAYDDMLKRIFENTTGLRTSL